MSRFLIVLNPHAGKGSGGKLRKKIIQSIRSRTSDFEVVETTKPGEAVEIARNASSPIVVAVGGDGTAHEVANGLFGSDKVLGVLPIGSGNDLIKSIGVPSDLDQSVASLISGKVALIDIGMAEVSQESGGLAYGSYAASYFVNGVGIGFDAAVAIRTQQIQYLSGTIVYILAVLQTLGRYVAPEFTVSVDDRMSRSRDLLIAIGNGRCAGGGFYLTPEAQIDDGSLDVCIVEAISTGAILKLMPRVMKGEHRHVRGVTFDRGERITVEASHAAAVHADGEILGEKIRSVRVSIMPHALGVVVGPLYSPTK